MSSPGRRLATIGGFELRPGHLLIVGVLALSFSASLLLRSHPAEYGFELNEFDPFFNYRATQYVVENGPGAYFEWHDDLSWHPEGRNVSLTSQAVLHLAAAAAYWAFGGGAPLYDFVIVFPAVLGALTSVVVFALVRVIGGTAAGLFASLLFAVSVPILIRGPLGWFKSEPLGLFLSLLATYMLLSGLHSRGRREALARLASAGVLTTLGLSAWGGNQFFLIPIGVFFLALPFLRADHRFLLWAVPLFAASTVLTSLAFERVSDNVVFGMGGAALLLPAAFVVACVLVQRRSAEARRRRNGLLLLAGLLAASGGLLAANGDGELFPVPSHRYLNALNPFLTTTDPLVDSVSEHATPTIQQSFFFHSVLMPFAGLGAWLLLRRAGGVRPDMAAFALILGMAGVYAGSSFLRLEVFAAISVIVMASLGLGMLVRELAARGGGRLLPGRLRAPALAGVVALLMVPMFYPPGSETHAVIGGPAIILNGGTSYVDTATTDWLDTLEWIRTSTPEDAVFASWWDYGYWISTMGERATIADNATLSTVAIEGLARMLLSPPAESWQMLRGMGADYLVVFAAANQPDLGLASPVLVLGGGGDESKKQWFMRIADIEEAEYLHPDGLSASDEFWDNTMLGRAIPYKLLGYVDPADLARQSGGYEPGYVGLYAPEVKFPAGGDGPLRLAYSSPSFSDAGPGPKLSVLVYEVNPGYSP